MEAAHRPAIGDQLAEPIAKLSSRVILALDGFTDGERAAVGRVARAFGRGEAPATRLRDVEPFYVLRVTPKLLVIVRYEAGQPIVIEDVVTQEAWDYLAHAG